MAITVDATLSTSSTNPVQNKAITLELNNKADSSSLPHGVPSGGTTGQVLVKSSNSDYAVEWQTVTVPSGTKNISISSNGTTTENVTNYATASITTNVPASAVDSGTKSITTNGNNQDVVGYAAVNVNVPNTYSAGDEGKVVSSGALVAQTAHADVTPTTSDQTIDTTTNNSIKVKGDANLVAGNIKKDVVIFNTTGSYEGGGGGMTFAPMDYPVIIQNGRTGTTVCFRIEYKADCILYPTSSSMQANATVTVNNMATDGTHFWIHPNGGSSLKYNGVEATYSVTDRGYMVTIPAGFDGTIPFVFS